MTVSASVWTITRHAVERYIERIRPGLAYPQALAYLTQESRGAHRVKEIEPGLWLWRGSKPRRLRFRITTAGELVTVLTSHDGMRRHLEC